MATVIVVEDLAAPASVGRGGLAAYTLQWLVGLQRLGHEVIFLEFLKSKDESTPAAVEYFRQTMETGGLLHQSALLVESSCESLFGLTANQIRAKADRAAAIITLAAHYRATPYPLVDRVRPRILIEQDPGYTHLWVGDGDPKKVFGEHDLYYTVGVNVGTPRCSLPTHGIDWLPIRNPVVLDWWKPNAPITRHCFTTVADWRSYGYLEFEGKVLGPKAEEFEKFIELPSLAGEPVEIALNIDRDDPDRGRLLAKNWKLEEPSVVSSIEDYRAFIQGSLGEFSCAKGGYVGTRCGWFSDRSACYLASGRPVILQSTGFEDELPTGKGLWAPRSVDEAAEAIRAVRADYAAHSAAARAIAEEYFDTDVVLPPMLRAAGVRG